MVARYNPDVDPTRLQPYGNPHAREVTTETDAETKARQKAAEDMAGEGDSAEEVKSKGPRRRGTKPEGQGNVKRLTGSKGLWVDDAGRVLREDGTVEAVLASPGPDMEPEKHEAAGVRKSEAENPENDASKDPKASDKEAETRAKTDPGTRAEAENKQESVAGQPKVDVSDTR